jgi:hypothetical protein
MFLFFTLTSHSRQHPNSPIFFTLLNFFLFNRASLPNFLFQSPLYSLYPLYTLQFISGVNFKHIKMEKKRLAAIARPPVRGMGEE